MFDPASMMAFGSMLSGGSDFLGGLTSALGIGGKGKGQNAANQFQWNRQWQIEQYKNRMQWMKEDAEKAGIHPLAALGAPLGSPAGATYGDSSSSRDIGSSIANMGQGIARATEAYGSREERELLKIGAKLDLENKQLQNERLRSEIGLMRQPGTPPGLTMVPAIDGQGDAVVVNPAEVTMSSSSNRGIQSGRGMDPANKEYAAYDGGKMLVPSNEYAEALEGAWPFGAIENLIRNTIPYYLDKHDRMVRRNLNKHFKKKGGY